VKKLFFFIPPKIWYKTFDVALLIGVGASQTGLRREWLYQKIGASK
jgi:hypothetical protein